MSIGDSDTDWRISLAHWGAFEARVRDGQILETRPFNKDPHPSPLTLSIPEAVHSEARIRQPMVRVGFLRHRGEDGERRRGGEPFVPVGWDEALELVADEIERVRTRYGNKSILGGSYGWSSAGRVNHARTLTRRFLFASGGCVDQVTNYSYGAAMTLLPHILGDHQAVSGPVTGWPGIIENAEIVVMFGGASIKNSYVTSGGAGSHEYVDWLRRAKERGVQFVNVSPIAADTPDFLDAEWLPIRPGSDTAMLLAMAYVLETEGLADQAFLERYTVGYPQFRSYLLGEADGIAKTPQWAAGQTQIDAATIARLARDVARRGSMLTATWSLQRADHGEQPYWALVALAAMAGQIGLPGRGFGFGYGSINGMGTPRPPVAGPAMEMGANPVGISIPVARVTDLLLNPGETLQYNGSSIVYPDIRLVYWGGGNPFHHHQDINRLLRAWQRPETVIVNEVWLTATARLADIVLPASTAYERDDIGSSSQDRFVIAMHQLVPPQGQARNDFDIYAELSERLGCKEAFTGGRDIHGWIRELYDRFRTRSARQGYDLPSFEDFWDAGHVELPRPNRDYTLLQDFRDDPDAHRLRTPSGRIEIFSERIAGFGYAECPGHPVWLAPREWLGGEAAQRFPLHMVSNQPSTRLHAQLDFGRVSRDAKICGREPIVINPADAAARNIRGGDVVRVFNDRGECLAGAVISETVRQGVVQLSTGAWFNPLEPGRVGSIDKHGNANMLTRDEGTSRLGQGASAQSVLVEVAPWSGDLPEVTAFHAPATAEDLGSF
jgi:biotin/methionine sulfoxide reductase